MLRASIFVLAPLLSAGLVVAFGFSALVACFGLALLTLVFSSTGDTIEAECGAEPGTQPARLLS